MTKIFKNMAPYWYMIVAIVLLLIVQAFGDLSLPQYTSDIIDVGIQNKGVEHILPVKMTEDEYEISQLYMTSKEKKIWKDTYEKKGEYYICKAEDEEKLDQLDDTFLTAIFLNHNMSNVKESQFKKMIKNSIASNPAMAPMKDKIDDMSVDEIGKMLNMKFKSFQEEDDNGKKVIYVDVRPMLYQMKQTGMMSAKDIQKSREEIENMSKKCYRFFGGLLNAQAKWLNKMSEKGYRLVRTGRVLYEFEECSPDEVTYCVEFIGEKSKENATDYADFLEDMGYKVFFKNINLNYSVGKVRLRPWAEMGGCIATNATTFNRELLIVEKSNDGKPFELHTSYADKEKYYRNLRNPWLFLLLLFALFAIIKHSIVLGIFSLVSAIPSILYQLQIINVRQKAKTWEQ